MSASSHPRQLFRDRPTGVDTANATYTYNPDGLRASKTVSSTTTDFTWDKAASLPLLLTETTGGNTTSYLYGPGDIPYAQIAADGTTTTYLHHDQLGSIRLLTDASGTQTGAATYNAYGDLNTSTGTLSNFGYAGQYTDPETGHQYLRARYYDPGTGQFLTRDPLEPITGTPHAYAADSPLVFTDPSGLLCARTVASRGSIASPYCDGDDPADRGIASFTFRNMSTGTTTHPTLFCGNTRYGWRHIINGDNGNHVEQMNAFTREQFVEIIGEILKAPKTVTFDDKRQTYRATGPVQSRDALTGAVIIEWQFKVVVSATTGRVITAYAGKPRYS